MSRPILFKNLAYFGGSDFDFVSQGSIRIEGGRIVQIAPQSAEANGVNGFTDHDTLIVDGTGYLALPGLINAALSIAAPSKDEIPEEVYEALDLSTHELKDDATTVLSEAVNYAVQTGTTTIALLADGATTKPLDPILAASPALQQCVLPFIAEPRNPAAYMPVDTRPELVEIVRVGPHRYTAKMAEPAVKSGKVNGVVHEGHYNIQCPHSTTPTPEAPKKGKQIVATGNVLFNSSNLWKELEIRARQLVASKHADEPSLKDLLRAVTVHPAELLGLFDGGILQTGSRADVILIKLKPHWQLTARGVLLSLFLHGNDPSLVHAVLRGGALHFSQGSLATELQALSLAKYYAAPNLPDTTKVDAGSCDFDSVEDAIEAFRRGEFLVAIDNEDRENEGDLIIAGEDMTAEKAAFMIRYTSGVICVSVDGQRLDELELPLMVENNTETLRTAYTISVDYKHGTTTGISAADRATTIRAIANPSIKASDFNRPGHVFPLRSVPGGTLKRVGHTEASVDFAKLAGKQKVAAICEIVLDDGRMARRDDLRVFSKQHGLKMVTISDLVKYRIANGLGEDW
ncbi:3,4-dihydroxy-2-butanone-4-phosphate synthase [Spizellomyces sp. 'palustris']|nr:3,4-dihydroxy-2-butanone-4-phosphate synthase [Spizellomyces sp. 'palustris']